MSFNILCHLNLVESLPLFSFSLLSCIWTVMKYRPNKYTWRDPGTNILPEDVNWVDYSQVRWWTMTDIYNVLNEDKEVIELGIGILLTWMQWYFSRYWTTRRSENQVFGASWHNIRLLDIINSKYSNMSIITWNLELGKSFNFF
jgi:endo-alpha-1,4-polygalactosaminidase (GH114 family)